MGDGGRWRPPPAERALGLGYYATSTPPVPGSIKSEADDFRVQEISEHPRPDPEGVYTILRVRSWDWEQHELADRLARQVGVPASGIAWAGTKDRRAVAERLFSYRGAPPAGPIDLPRVEVLGSYRARDGLSLGHHYGNAFAIRVRSVGDRPPGAYSAFEATRREVQSLGGIPNFFGLQRFGEVRPVTHLVGRALALGDPSRAVEIYLTEVQDGSDSSGDRARREFASHHDPVRALQEFPPSYRFERTLLDHLARGHTPQRALGALSRELRTLFLHAYQSLLFNRWLTLRYDRGLPLLVPEIGDRLLRIGSDGTVSTAAGVVAVTEDNRREAREAVERQRAVVAGPIVGFDTPRGTTSVDELLEELLREEGVGRDAFRLPSMPELASAGTWRSAGVRAPAIGLVAEAAPDGTAPVGPVRLEFLLPRGSYATVVVREFLKTGAVAAGPTEPVDRPVAPAS